MASTESADKPKMETEKSKYDDKENDSKELKSKDRERNDSRSRKKHKKKRSSSSDSSDSSRSRSRSNRKSHRKHKSKRSRSRSPKRSKHSSRKRSRSRSPRKHRSHRSRSRSKKESAPIDKKKEAPKEKDRKKGFKFDSPPKEMQLAEESIDLTEFGIPNIEVLKEMYPALKAMDPSELLQKLQMINDIKNLKTSKVDRKLYIGNIPTGLTPQMLMDLLNSALQKMGINVDPPGNSIIGAWISPDNNYAFVDFRTPEEATAGFAMNSVAIHGQTLKVGRPRSYQQGQDNTNPLQALFGITGLPTNPLGPLGQGEGTMNTNLKIQTHSRILVLKNMVQISDLEIDEEYNEIVEDVKEGCEKHGKVLSMKVPRPIKDVKDVPGLGKIFVEYATVDEAKEARKELHGSTFDGRTVEVSFYSEEKYATNDFSEA